MPGVARKDGPQTPGLPSGQGRGRIDDRGDAPLKGVGIRRGERLITTPTRGRDNVSVHALAGAAQAIGVTAPDLADMSDPLLHARGAWTRNVAPAGAHVDVTNLIE